MKRQWQGVLSGFAAGMLLMLVISRIVSVHSAKPEQNTESQQEEQQKMDSVSEEEMQAMPDQESVAGEIADKETDAQGIVVEENADEVNDGYYISDHVQIPADFTEQILLYGYIEYGIRKYNEANKQTDTYSCNLEEDMLPFETEFCMTDGDQEPFKTDLAKEIIPELVNNIYNFRLENQNTTIYMSIDTYNMKIYVYDAMSQ